jgi:predicted DNA-binding protein with PD1-like motif
MKWRLLNDQGGARTFVLVFAYGDTVTDPLLGFLKSQSVGAARLSGIGALRR